MSTMICHMTKFTRGAVRGIQAHNEREKDHSNTNPDIDFSKSHENYNLHLDELRRMQQSQQMHADQVNYHRAISERIKQLQLPKAVRTDAVVMCGFVVTSDTTFFDKLNPEQQREFFKQSYDALAARYGKENIVSAAVHMDEKTPHMHVELVPVTKDGKLSAKALFDRKEMRDLQTFMHGAVGSPWGLERGVEGSKAKHVEMARMKLQDAEKRLQDIEKEIADKLATVEKQRDIIIVSAKAEAEKVRESITPLLRQKADLEQDIEARKALRGAIIPVKEHKNLLTGKVTEVTMSKEVYDACVSAQHRADHADRRANEAERELRYMKNNPAFEKAQQLEKRLDKMTEELRVTKSQNYYQQRQVEWMEKAFAARPELQQEMSAVVKMAERGLNLGLEDR